MIRVDQQPLGNTPTSNPATYTGVFDLIRTLVSPNCPRRGCAATRRGGSASTCPAAAARRARGTANCGSRCTFCPTCGSSATRAAAAATIPRRWPSAITASRSPTCSTCRAAGRCKLFENIPKIRRILQTLCDVGLDYSDARPAGPDALRRRGPARQAGRRTGPARHRPHALSARRTDHRPALRRPRQAARRAQSAGRSGQHGGGDRAQSGRHQDGRLGDRHGARGRRDGAASRGGRHAGRGRGAVAVASGQWREQRSGAQRSGVTAGLSDSGIALAHGRGARARAGRRAARETRRRYDFAAADGRPRRATSTSTRSAASRKMPWEADGRRWHTHDRVGRNGQPCRWDGRILERGGRSRFKSWASSARPIGTSAASSKSRPRKSRTAGSSTPSPASNGC